MPVGEIFKSDSIAPELAAIQLRLHRRTCPEQEKKLSPEHTQKTLDNTRLPVIMGAR
jgi:hypothetical protein